MFFIHHGIVYQLAADGGGYMLQTGGHEQPCNWIWNVLPPDTINEIHQVYIRECNERNRYTSLREFQDR